MLISKGLAVSEFVNMMSSFQSWRKTVEDFELTNYEKARKENKTVREGALLIFLMYQG